MHSLNWDDMRYFLALCRQGSATGAAKVLGVNHTTVTRRISALEKDIGTRLFSVSRSGHEMSQAAENLYSHALKMEEISHAIDREVFGQDAELRGPLKITVSHDVAERLLIPFLPDFKDAYPCIDLDILTSTGLVDLAAREADIALRLTAKPPDYLVGRQVLPMRHGVYGSSNYIKSLSEKTKLVLFRGDPERPEWVQQHFPDSEIAMRVDDVSTMAAAVVSSMGLARMPCYVGDAEPSILRLNLTLTPSTWGIWILSHVDLKSSARVRVAREFLIDVIEKQRTLVLGEESRYPTN